MVLYKTDNNKYIVNPAIKNDLLAAALLRNLLFVDSTHQ